MIILARSKELLIQGKPKYGWFLTESNLWLVQKITVELFFCHTT